MPDAVPMVAMPGLLLLHVPPLVAFASVMLLPAHTVARPVVATGPPTTVSVVVAPQPVLKVYEIVVVPSAAVVATPFTPPIDATAVLLLVHAPPLGASEKVITVPTHACDTPVIGTGTRFTVSSAVLIQPEPSV